MKKSNLPQKICPVCNFPFNWRKKWKKNWDNVFIVVKNVECQKINHDNKLVEGTNYLSNLSKIFL